MSTIPPPVSTAQALGMLRSAMGYLSAADATAMAAETQAQCLQALEQVNSMGTAARSSILAAFTFVQGYTADAEWAAHRAAASVGGSDGAAWLDGDAAQAMACDAAMTPVVTGDVNPAAVDDLVRLCVDLDRLRHHASTGTDGGTGSTGTGSGQGEPGPDTTRAWEALEQAIIGKAVDLVSGPGGLASFLRRRQLGARLGGPSLPLDVGVSKDIPAAIRNAVILRDQHCQWTGGCDQPASACEVHHLTHKADGGKTSVKDCILFCWYHHQVVIHRMGWTVVLNPDGTTTAWNPDKTKILHSHSPPANTG